jgi:sulfite reductase beta subunit-like hemoprotein
MPLFWLTYKSFLSMLCLMQTGFVDKLKSRLTAHGRSIADAEQLIAHNQYVVIHGIFSEATDAVEATATALEFVEAALTAQEFANSQKNQQPLH